MICLWIPHTILDSANAVADSANSPIFGAISSGAMFQVFVWGIQNSKEDQRKRAMLRISRPIWLWPVAEPIYSAQNAQFGLVM